MAKKKIKKPINPSMLVEHFLGGVVVRSFRPVLLDNFKTRTLHEQEEDDTEGDAEPGKPRVKEIEPTSLTKSVIKGRDDTENNETALTLWFTTNVAFNVEDIQLIYQSRQESIDAKVERMKSKKGKKYGSSDVVGGGSDDEVEKAILAKMQSKKSGAEFSSVQPDPDWYVDDLSSLKKQIRMPQNRDVNKKLATLQASGRITPGYFVGIAGTEGGIIINPQRISFILEELIKNIDAGKIDAPIVGDIDIEVHIEADDEYEWNNDLYRKISFEYAKALEQILLFDRPAFSFIKEVPQNALVLPSLKKWGKSPRQSKVSKSSGALSPSSVGSLSGDEPQ